MTALLDKFRINYSDLIVIDDVNDEPKVTTKDWFDSIVRTEPDLVRRATGSGTERSSNTITIIFDDNNSLR